MLGRLVPAVTVAAQNLQNAMNTRHASGSAAKADHKGADVSSPTKGKLTAGSPFASAGSHTLKKRHAAGHSPFASALASSQTHVILASSPIDGATSDDVEGLHDPKPQGIFSDEDKQKIIEGKNVYVAGFSSQGGGHTERMLMPLGMAAMKGDTVVLALPPHWEVDGGNEAKKLADFTAKYNDKGVNVVTVQSDKAIWGFYKPEGPSDNFRILEEFANKPQRDNANIPLFGSESEKGQGFKHKDIVQQVVNIVGNDNMAKIKVFEDMDPYLGKAATNAGIPKDQIVGQSNHVLLLDADDYFGSKSDAFLVKVNGNGHNGQMATIDLNPKINPTRALGMTASDLGIAASQRAVDVRKDMVATILEHGNKHDLNSTEPVSRDGVVLVSPKATKDTIDRGVYIYVNKYSKPVGEHIIKRLKGEGDTTPAQQAAYEKTIFSFCGSKALSKETPGSTNVMHRHQLAQHDAFVQAGFGNMSESKDLIEGNGYKGKFLLMPVEQQHEQEANANVLLPAALSEAGRGRLDTAGTVEEACAKLDDMVVNKATTDEVLGDTTMQAFLESTQREGDSSYDKADRLLRGAEVGMNANDVRLLEENNWRAQEAGRKEMRQLNKVMIPVLEALTKGESEATIQLSTKVEARTVNVEEVVKALNNPAKLRELTGVNITNQTARNMSNDFAKDLKLVMEQPEGPDRQNMADHYRRGPYANDKYILGY